MPKKCDNSRHTLGCVITPQCMRQNATKTVTVRYNEVESDVVDLCEDCAARVAADARGRGYSVSVLPFAD